MLSRLSGKSMRREVRFWSSTLTVVAFPLQRLQTTPSNSRCVSLYIMGIQSLISVSFHGLLVVPCSPSIIRLLSTKTESLSISRTKSSWPSLCRIMSSMATRSSPIRIEIQQRTTGADTPTDLDLIKKIDELYTFSSPTEREAILEGLKWMGLFSHEPASLYGNLLDTLSAQRSKLCSFQPGERDLVVLQHKFVVKWKDGSEVSNYRLPPPISFLLSW